MGEARELEEVRSFNTMNLICLACFIVTLISGLWCFLAHHVCEDLHGWSVRTTCSMCSRNGQCCEFTELSDLWDGDEVVLSCLRIRRLNVIRKFCHKFKFIQLLWWLYVYIYARSPDPDVGMTNCKTNRLVQGGVWSPRNAYRFNCWFILRKYTRLVEVSTLRNHQPSERNELVRKYLMLL